MSKCCVLPNKVIQDGKGHLVIGVRHSFLIIGARIIIRLILISLINKCKKLICLSPYLIPNLSLPNYNISNRYTGEKHIICHQ